MKYLLIFLTSVCFFSSFVQAGKMKEVSYEHERAVSLLLWDSEEPDFSKLKNTRFVTAAETFFIALASDVMVYSPKKNAFEWIVCTTQFAKVNESINTGPTKCESK